MKYFRAQSISAGYDENQIHWIFLFADFYQLVPKPTPLPNDLQASGTALATEEICYICQIDSQFQKLYRRCIGFIYINNLRPGINFHPVIYLNQILRTSIIAFSMYEAKTMTQSNVLEIYTLKCDDTDTNQNR